MDWATLLQTQGPLIVGALLRLGVAYLNARSIKLEGKQEGE